ncbi:MAG: response regulator transcription factor [Chthoniobacteraceae bacterium]
MPDKKRIFLVDDHPLVREWLANLINQEEDLMVCGSAPNAPEALAAIQAMEPDAAVIDIALERGSGLELLKNVKVCCPRVTMLVLSMHEESAYAERALRAGARGYLTKRETTQKVITAIRQVLAGKLYISEAFAAAMAERIFEGGGSGVAGEELSDRELQVFELLGAGQETWRIAESLNISMKTVQTYCLRIKEKLHLSNASELIREAVRWQDRKQGGV